MKRYKGFNPYCYWSYLLTKENYNKFNSIKGGTLFQSLLLLVLSFNIGQWVDITDKIKIKVVSILIVTGLIF